MRLLDLEPQFVRFESRIEQRTHRREDGTEYEWTGPCEYHVDVDTITEAQGVRFLCPKCFAANGGPVGTHVVVCWSRSRNVPEDARPGPGRWAMNGTGYHDLTLDADPPSTARSVALTGGCKWHGFITNGEAETA